MIANASEFCRLRESEDPADYFRAAHEEAAVEVWAEVLAQRPDMAFWVAQNKTVPVVILEQLAADESVDVGVMVARKRKIPEQIAIGLAGDPDETVRAALARNPKLPQVPSTCFFRTHPRWFAKH
jgi:hypothetical protein